MAGIAVNRLKITVFDFYDMTPVEFHYALTDYNEVTLNQRTFLFRTLYEVGRFIGFWITRPHMKRGRLKDPTQLVKFQWEIDQEPVVQSQAEIIKEVTRIAAFYKKNKRVKTEKK